ncbi:hypothetical protein SAMN05414139_05460 [Burkholderia sp. D7]|nr:hypothetical protein SAMN05414139_05460 [Burkholderia sp. D7]
MTYVDVVVRILAAGASLLVFYVAWCVYENEEKVLQSKIEVWWLQFDDLRGRMVTRHAAFVGVVSGRTKAVLDRIFRGRLLSVDSVATAGTLCMGSFLLVLVALAETGVIEDADNPTIIEMSSIAFVCAVCCVAPAFWPVLRWLPAGAVALALVAMAIEAWTDTVPNKVFIFVVTGFGFITSSAFTLLAVSIARRSLALAAKTRSEWRVLTGGVSILGIPISIVLALYLAKPYIHRNIDRLDSFFIPLMYTAGGIAVALCCVLLFIAIACIMLLHSAAWPLMSRLLYGLPRHRIVENKKALNCIALALLGVAISGSYSWNQLWKFIGL